MSDESKPMNLVQKLASIRRDLKNIEKKGRNTFQNYDYLRAEDIAGEMGDRLAAMNVIVARRNLSFVQDNITVTKDGNERTDVHVIVTLDYVFIDGERPVDSDDESAVPSYETVVIASIGEGRDSGDKAVAKAMTNALKYALTQPLMMRVGDDPEADAEHDQPETRKVAQNGSNARETASTGRGADETLLKTTRISLMKKAKERLGEQDGAKWLILATKELGKTSEDLTLKEMLELEERLTGMRLSNSTNPAGGTPQDDPDLNW